MSLKDKIRKARSKLATMKQQSDAKRMKQAEARAIALEKQAEYDKKLISVYKRQDKAKKASEARKKYESGGKSGKGAFSGLGDFASGFGGGSMFGDSGVLPFGGSSGKKGKKKNNDYSIF